MQWLPGKKLSEGPKLRCKFHLVKVQSVKVHKQLWAPFGDLSNCHSDNLVSGSDLVATLSGLAAQGGNRPPNFLVGAPCPPKISIVYICSCILYTTVPSHRDPLHVTGHLGEGFAPCLHESAWSWWTRWPNLMRQSIVLARLSFGIFVKVCVCEQMHVHTVWDVFALKAGKLGDKPLVQVTQLGHYHLSPFRLVAAVWWTRYGRMNCGALQLSRACKSAVYQWCWPE